jgi:hypothetical protein
MKNLFLKLINKLKRFYGLFFPLNKLFFGLHEFFIVLIYGKTSDYFEFRISNELLSKLKLYLNNLDFLNFIDSPSDKENVLMFNSISIETKSKLDDNIRIMDLNSQDSLFLELQKELYDNVKYYVKSKICFCNIRAWKTLPQSELFGPNQLHTDGFLKGHLKIMLYI